MKMAGIKVSYANSTLFGFIGAVLANTKKTVTKIY